MATLHFLVFDDVDCLGSASQRFSRRSLSLDLFFSCSNWNYGFWGNTNYVLLFSLSNMSQKSLHKSAYLFIYYSCKYSIVCHLFNS